MATSVSWSEKAEYVDVRRVEPCLTRSTDQWGNFEEYWCQGTSWMPLYTEFVTYVAVEYTNGQNAEIYVSGNSNVDIRGGMQLGEDPKIK